MGRDYDAAVIGGGPGGYVAAIRLAQLGKKTVLIEKDLLGGVCLNRGCIPTKALLHSAEIYETAKRSEEYGISFKGVKFDYSKIYDRKENIVARLRKGIEFLEKKAGVDVVYGTACFKDEKTIAVGDEEINARNIIIATGAEPASIPVPGIDSEGVIDSNDVLAMSKCPKSIAIIGGGVIGIEFASLFSAFGADVTVIEMTEQILPAADEEIASIIRKELEKRGVKIYTGAKVEFIEPGVVVTFNKDGQKKVSAEKCVIAAGRRPVTEGMDLHNIGLKLERGFIVVDNHMQTNIPGIYAIGDVTGKMQLAHVASAQGLVAAENIAGRRRKMNYEIIPCCVYCDPEIAWVGHSENEAKQRGLDIAVGRFNSAGNGRSVIMGSTSGLVKIITDNATGEILGGHMIAPRATDMINEVCSVMRSEGTVDELADTIHAHPTISEMIMEAAHDAKRHT